MNANLENMEVEDPPSQPKKIKVANNEERAAIYSALLQNQQQQNNYDLSSNKYNPCWRNHPNL